MKLKTAVILSDCLQEVLKNEKDAYLAYQEMEHNFSDRMEKPALIENAHANYLKHRERWAEINAALKDFQETEI